MELRNLTVSRLEALLAADHEGAQAENARAGERYFALLREKMIAAGLPALETPPEGTFAKGREIAERLSRRMNAVLARRMIEEGDDAPLMTDREIRDLFQDALREIAGAMREMCGEDVEEARRAEEVMNAALETTIADVKAAYGDDDRGAWNLRITAVYAVASEHGLEPEAVLRDPALRPEVARRYMTPKWYREKRLAPHVLANTAGAKRVVAAVMAENEPYLDAEERADIAADAARYAEGYCKAAVEAMTAIIDEDIARIWPSRL